MHGHQNVKFVNFMLKVKACDSTSCVQVVQDSDRGGLLCCNEHLKQVK